MTDIIIPYKKYKGKKIEELINDIEGIEYLFR